VGAKPPCKQSLVELRKLRRKLQRLDPASPNYRLARASILEDIQLAKAQMQRSRSGARRAPSARRRPAPGRKKNAAKRGAASSLMPTPSATPNAGALSRLFSAKNLQESLKSVGNLRTTVKNWLQYLQQADQILDTLHITSNSLRETGVLDKLVKHKGKNLSTEDFTNILIALMNTPLGAQLLKSDNNQGASSSGAAANPIPPSGPPPNHTPEY
jgi:hypothetical protein